MVAPVGDRARTVRVSSDTCRTVGRRGRAKLKRDEQSAAGRVGAPETHVTVAALRNAPGHDLSQEIALVKAALLYADRVTLASPQVLLYGSLLPLVAGSESTREALMEESLGSLNPEAAQAMVIYAELKGKRRRTLDEQRFVSGMRGMLKEGGDEVAAGANGVLEQTGIHELIEAGKAGVLDFHSLGAYEAQDLEFARSRDAGDGRTTSAAR